MPPFFPAGGFVHSCGEFRPFGNPNHPEVCSSSTVEACVEIRDASHPRHRLTEDAVEIAVLPTHGTIAFRPGQFVVLEVDLETGPRRSAFSIVHGEGKGITLGIKVALLLLV